MKFTLPLLSLCTVALALAGGTANITRVVDTKAHMNGTKTGVVSGHDIFMARAHLTETIQDTEKRTLGNVYANVPVVAVNIEQPLTYFLPDSFALRRSSRALRHYRVNSTAGASTWLWTSTTKCQVSDLVGDIQCTSIAT
jgi:hypothetical protein